VTGLFENLPLKAASLGIAVVLWFVIAGEKTSERGLAVPVELQNVPANLEMTGEAVNTVEVRLRASPGIIHALGPGEISAQVDLAGSGEGERIIHLSPEAIRVPFGVRVVKITPSILTLSFERTLQKVVPVRPRLLGRPAPGREVTEVTSDPAVVRISGPRSRVLEVESAFTEPVSLEGAGADVTEAVNVGLDDPMLRLMGSPRVKVTARLTEIKDRRTFEGLAVTVRGGPAQIHPATVRVTLAGPRTVLDRLRTEDLHPYVTLDPVGTGVAQSATVALDLPTASPGLSVVLVEPAELTLKPSGKRN
jgi:YbbR domain-containing protein